MEIKQLQIFLTAAKTLSFTETAQQCFVVQSAVSQQIAALEKDLGVQLFVREKRAIRLTPEGEVLYREAQAILGQVKHARQQVISASQGFIESLHIGRHGDALRNELPAVLRAMLCDHPNLRFHMTRGNAGELLEALENRRIDCVLTVLCAEHRLYPWLDFRVIRREPVKVMISADHPLASRGRISVTELGGLPVLLLAGSDKKDRLASMADEGFSGGSVTYVDSQNSIEQLAAAGCGISFMAAGVCRPHPMLTYLELENAPQVEIAVCWNRSNQPAMLEGFVQALTDGVHAGIS